MAIGPKNMDHAMVWKGYGYDCTVYVLSGNPLFKFNKNTLNVYASRTVSTVKAVEKACQIPFRMPGRFAARKESLDALNEGINFTIQASAIRNPRNINCPT